MHIVDSNVSCRRCGLCCRKGGPGLHTEDMPLFDAGTLSVSHVITLRRGETVHDNPTGKITTLQNEVLRLCAPDGKGCPYLQEVPKDQPSSCSIHGTHPLECRTLSCTVPSALQSIYTNTRLKRVDLLGKESDIYAAVRYHDETFPAKLIFDLASHIADRIKHKTQSQCRAEITRLSDLASHEHAFRLTLLERTSIPESHLFFLLGRPIPTLVAPLGLSIV